ncbi:AlpA family transcriptional regulator [Gammaproteobacteria bacterium]|nr:AlpA family transcriptional regulator [Gammaproteobacteria bacterium]
MRSQTKHRFIRISEVKSTTGLSRSHIYDLISKGEFPRQYKLGERASGWLESEVLMWIQSKITSADSSNQSDAS